jgi:hypothetical protein
MRATARFSRSGVPWLTCYRVLSRLDGASGGFLLVIELACPLRLAVDPSSAICSSLKSRRGLKSAPGLILASGTMISVPVIARSFVSSSSASSLSGCGSVARSKRASAWLRPARSGASAACVDGGRDRLQCAPAGAAYVVEVGRAAVGGACGYRTG